MDEPSEPYESLPWPAESSQPPPLRIHHLLVWTAATAALLSAVMWFDRTFRNGPPIEDRVVVAGLVLGAVAIAGALTCVAWGVYLRKAGIEFPRDPGERLLTLVAKCALAFPAAVLGAFVVFLVEEDLMWLYSAVAGIIMFVVFIRQNALGLAHGESMAWKAFFFYLAFAPILAVAVTPLSLAMGIGIACILFAAWTDYRDRYTRRWTHWAGVVAGVALCSAIALVAH